MEQQQLVRSNKVTAYWEGEGVAVGIFYKTHTKLKEIKSTSEEVVAAGFTMPVGTEEEPVKASDKLSAFKTFLQVNASTFGITYDPVDRRNDEFKFPNKYDEETLKEYSAIMVDKSMGECLSKIQDNVVANMIKSKHLAEESEIMYEIGKEPRISVSESYANGNIKYADAEYDVTIGLGGATVDTVCKVTVVSGQLKKPREFGEGISLIQTGMKDFLTNAGILPVVVKPEKVKKEESETAEVAE